VTAWRGLRQASNKMPRDRVTELPFHGLRVFLPRNYVPPEKFPALHDLLRNNGAEVCPILNASCNSNVDFHVMADNQTAKIKELLSKGCKVVGKSLYFVYFILTI
jgi:hypothetical protein